MAKEQNKDKKYVFRRVNGRIIPIAVGAVGLGATAQAANTTRVYQRGNVTIDKKKVSFAPVMTKFGTRFDMKVGGKQVANATTYLDKGTGEVGFAWIGVNKEARGKGYSKTLSKEAVRDNVRRGGKFQFSQVIHKNSAGTNFDGKRDKLLYMFQDNKQGQKFRPIGVKKAEEHIARQDRANRKIIEEYAIDAKKSTKAIRKLDPRRPTTILQKFSRFVRDNYEFQNAKLGKANSRVFRRTSFKGMKSTTKFAKEFRTPKNKLQLGLGLGLVAAGLYGAKKDGKK